MLRLAILFGLAVTAAFAARDALTGTAPFSYYSAALAVALIAVFIGTAMRWKPGINASTVNCPTCSAAQPFMRKPASFRQAMWGGYTCSQCGTEIDKWGRKVEA
jgi:hypothetical protein